jgi:AcrR family transcriptional regulator
MRRVAEALGVAPMTLYTYVPGKAELLDLMLDAAYTGMPRLDTSGEPWRHRLTAIAEENKALFENHPWAATVSTIRPPLGRNDDQITSTNYRLWRIWSRRCQMDASLTTYTLQAWGVQRPALAPRIRTVRWTPRMVALPAPARPRTDEKAYPIAARVRSVAGAAHDSAYSPAHAYTFGLARVLDGLSTLIDPAETGA